MVPPERESRAQGHASRDTSPSHAQSSGAAKARADQQAAAVVLNRLTFDGIDGMQAFLELSPAEQQALLPQVLRRPQLDNEVMVAMGFFKHEADPNWLAAKWRTLPAPLRAQVLKLALNSDTPWPSTLELALIITPSERKPYLHKILRIDHNVLKGEGIKPAFLPRLQALDAEIKQEPLLQRMGDSWHHATLLTSAKQAVKAKQIADTHANDEVDANRILPANLTDPRELRRQFDAETDLTRMRALAERRFGIQFNHMTVPALRRLWPVLERLPRNDVLTARRIVGQVEETGSFGEWENGHVTIESALAGAAWWNKLLKTGTWLFDRFVRHEVGHAVDEQLHISDTYGKTVDGGGWREHSDPEALAHELVQGSHGGIGSIRDPRKRAEAIHGLAQLISGEKPLGTVDRVKIGLEQAIPFSSVGAQARDPATEAVMAGSAWNLWSDLTNLPAINGRCYKRVSDGSRYWVSYAAVAKKHKVSDYQFNAAAEWFAEAYAAFYDPKFADPTKDNELKRHDPVTHDYFLKHVHKHVQPPATDQG